MKQLTGILILLFFFSLPVSGKTMYIRDILSFTVRAGQGTNYKIITRVNSGQLLEVLETGKKWTKVLLPDGQQGWIISSLLTTQEPISSELKTLKKEHDKLLAEAENSRQQIRIFKDENKKLKGKSGSAGEELNELREVKKSYEALKTEMAELEKGSKNYLDLKAQFAELSKKYKKNEEEMARLEQRQILRWFISGAIVMLIGIIVGYNTRRKRKRLLS